jgi:predicted TIM-barrel fold metal-dependent hydrolase
MFLKRLMPCFCAVVVATAAVSCAAADGGAVEEGDDNDDDDAAGRSQAITAKPLSIDGQRIVRALEAENAALRRQLKDGVSADPYRGLINAHEHLYKLTDLERYLPSARAANIATTVVVASPEFTIMGKGEKGEPGMSENFETLLAAAKKYPDEIIPFCTIDPSDPKKLERLKAHVAAGAKGLKLYNGHSNFYDGALARADMDAVFSYLESTGLPVNWHINLAKFMPEFERVMHAHPKLNVMVPHYGVAFWRPKGDTLTKLSALMTTYPGLFVDTSLGTREILLDGMAVIEPHRATFQAFFADHQDQIVWGTDSVITGNAEKSPSWYHKVIWATRDHLEKDVFQTELAAGYSRYWKKGRDAEGRYQGLALSPAIMQKVYVDNARRWLKLPSSPPTPTPTPTPE